MRIKHAKFLLATSDMPVEKIAEARGYNSEVHFYRQFKEVVGCSPSKYRENEFTYLKLENTD